MLYETPPMLTGENDVDLRVLRAYLFRLSEMLNIGSQAAATPPAEEAAVTSFFAVLPRGELVPILCRNGTVTGSVALYDSNTASVVVVVLYGTYPYGERPPLPDDIKGRYFMVNGGEISPPAAITGAYKPVDIIS